MKTICEFNHKVTLTPLFMIAIILGCGTETVAQPQADLVPATNTYHGIELVDNYQWLENSDDHKVQDWDRGQNEFTRSILDAIPCRKLIEDELRQLYEKSSSRYYSFSFVAGKLFAKKMQPPNDQAMLVQLDSPYDLSGEKVVVNPNKIDSAGQTSIDFYVVSPDGSLVAVSMSKSGTEDGQVSVYQTDNGQKLVDYVPKVNGPTAGGDVAWKPDNSGFYYTHYPRDGEQPPEEMRFHQKVYWHKLGTPTEQDEYVLGREFPHIAEIEFETSPDGSNIVAVVSNGDGGEYEHWLLQSLGKWERITRFKDEISTVRFGDDNSLYLLSTKEANFGMILHLPAGTTNLKKAKVLVEEGDAVIRDFMPTKDNLYLVEMVGGPMRLRILDKKGTFQKNLSIRPISSVAGLTRLDGNHVMYRNSSYLEPSAWYVYQDNENRTIPTQFVETSPADFSNVEVRREIVISKDGTKVPMTILLSKGTELNRSNPTILYGYGGYGISLTPYFQESLNLWLNRGGVYAIANIRGGGEFGEQWHKQGYLTKKQNVFDDFAACAEHLIDNGYTGRDHLAIRGGSNGGLLVGAVMVQHPGLFKAVVCQKGVLDMLRVELHPNGQFNTTEFGTVTKRDQFEALYAYSPYHNIKDGIDYPDVLFTADVNDGRVDAYNSRKMTARLQSADAVKGQTLLRVSSGGGHGMGMSKSDQISQDADIWAFFFDQLGVECK